MPAMNEFNPLRDAVPLGEIRRALVIKLRHHGDVLVASPVFSALKAHAPQALRPAPLPAPAPEAPAPEKPKRVRAARPKAATAAKKPRAPQ